MSRYESPEIAQWLLDRLGHVTASRIADVLSEPRSKADKEAGKLGLTALTYLDELVGETLSGRPSEEISSKAIEWGNTYEPEARDAYCWLTGNATIGTGKQLVRHKTEPLIACTPDAFIPPSLALEIKCPMTLKNHARVLRTGEMPDDHEAQVQASIWIMELDHYEFVSYHPWFPKELQLVVVRVDRDEAFIKDMVPKVLKFRDLLVTLVEEQRKKIH